MKVVSHTKCGDCLYASCPGCPRYLDNFKICDGSGVKFTPKEYGRVSLALSSTGKHEFLMVVHTGNDQIFSTTNSAENVVALLRNVYINNRVEVFNKRGDFILEKFSLEPTINRTGEKIGDYE